MKLWRQVDGVLLRTATDHADKIREAIRSSVNVDDIIQAWHHAYPAGGSIRPADARAWARLNIHPKSETLAAVLRLVRANGWVLGSDVAVAGYAQAKIRTSNKAPTAEDLNAALTTNWDNWTPGNRGAAELVAPSGGLRQLLNRGNADIKGINDTTLDRIGTHLADALNTGSAFTSLADTLLRDNMLATIEDPNRALAIAVTETSRALNVSAMDSYNEFGVEKVEWLALEPCEECEDNDGEVVELGQEFPSGDTEPPVHPNCRCTVLPVVDDSAPAALADDEGDSIDAIEETPTEPDSTFDDFVTSEVTDTVAGEALGETEAVIPDAIEGRTITTQYEAANELWKPLVEDLTDQTYNNTHLDSPATAASLKQAVSENLSANLADYAIEDVMTAARFDEYDIINMTNPNPDATGIGNFFAVSRNNEGMVQPYRGNFIPERTYKAANPELVNITDWQSVVTRDQFENTLRYINDNPVDGRAMTVFSPGTPEANQLLREGSSNYFIKTWAQTSNNENILSLAFQDVAKEHFGLSNTADWQIDKSTRDRVDALINAHSDIYKTILQTQYDATQAFFKERGITEITLFRGVREYATGSTVSGTGITNIMRPLSSFSTSTKTALGFAKSYNNSAVFEYTVPVERILSMPGTGFGCFEEYETVVLGGTQEMNVANARDFQDWVSQLGKPTDFWKK